MKDMKEKTRSSFEIGEWDLQEYSQVVPMTFEERVAMYMKCSKLDLARMLAERDTLRMDYPVPMMPYYAPCPQPQPVDPYYNYEITCNEGTASTINKENGV